MDFIKIKKIFILTLAILTAFLSIAGIISFANKPNIKNINIPDMTNIQFLSSNNDTKDIIEQTKPSSFSYELIGYRFGEKDSSAILKKGNKEYVVAKGQKLEGIYELIEVNENEVIFRNQGKLYKIENLVGK